MDIGSLTGSIELEDEVSSTLAEIGHKVKEFAGELEGGLGMAAVGITAAVAAVGAMTAVVVGLGDKGSVIQGVTENFDRMALAAGTTGDALREKLSAGVKGTVDELALMEATSRLLTSGMKLTEDQAELMGQAARALGKATGGDATSGLSLLSNALTTGRVRGLAMAGVTVDLKAAEEKYARSIGVTASELTREGKLHADQGAIFDALRKKVDQMGDSQLNFKERLAQASVALTQWFDDLSVAVATSPHVMAAVDAIGAAIQSTFGGAGQTALEVVVGWINKFADAVTTYGPAIIQTIGDIWNEIVDLWHTVQSAWDIVPDWFKNIARDAGLASVAVGLSAEAFTALGGSDLISTGASIAQIGSTLADLTIAMFTSIPAFVAVKAAALETAFATGIMSGAVGLLVLDLATIFIPLAAGYEVIRLGIELWHDYWDSVGRLDQGKDQTKAMAETTARIMRINGLLEEGPTIDPKVLAARETSAHEQVLTNKAAADKKYWDLQTRLQEASIARKLREGEVNVRLGRDELARGELIGLNALKMAGDLNKGVKDLEGTTASLGSVSNLALMNMGDNLGTVADEASNARRETVRFATEFAGPIDEVTRMTETFGETLSRSFSALPDLLISSFTGGGGMAGALKGFGATFGRDLFGKEGALSGVTDGVRSWAGPIGKALGDMLPGIGALLGPALSALWGGLKSAFGGPSKAELAGRDIAGQFQASIDQTLTAKERLSGMSWIDVIGRDFVKAGKTVEDAQAAITKLWDAEKQGPDATRQALLELQSVIEDSDHALSDMPKSAADEAQAAGYKTRADLEKTAQKALQTYEYMRDSGLYTADEIARAFEASATAQQAAFSSSTKAISSQLDAFKTLSDSIAGEKAEDDMGVLEKSARAQMQVIEEQAKEQLRINGMTAQEAADAWDAAFKALDPQTLEVPFIFVQKGPSPGEGIVAGDHLAGGGTVYAAGGWSPSGTDIVPAMLTPGERVLTVSQNKAYESGSGAPMIAKVILDGREIGEAAFKHMAPAAQRMLGVGR